MLQLMWLDTHKQIHAIFRIWYGLLKNKRIRLNEYSAHEVLQGIQDTMNDLQTKH